MPRPTHILLILVIIAGFVLLAGCVSQPSGPPATPSTQTPASSISDFTNQNSPEAATFTAYPAHTKLHTPDLPVGLRFVAGGFTAPIDIADPHDGSGRLFLADQTGYVKIFYPNSTIIDQPFFDVRDRMVKLDPTYDERGLLSIAFHPQFASNGRVFAYYSAPLRSGADPNWSATNRLSEFHISATDPNRVDMSTEKVLLEVDKPYENHNGGQILFGPDDGYLYLPLGDGGRADDTGMGHNPGIGNAQDLTKILGKVIRIDVDHTSPGKQYAIPPDNPFLSNSSMLPEIYAYGFRNPAFATFDSGGSHRMFIAMAGQRLFESALIVYKGGAYPWNIREGTHCFSPANDSQVPSRPCRATSYNGQPLIGPVVELGHDVGNTIVGGVVYRGSQIPSLQGNYIYGTWSDESRTIGNGTLLISKPPAGLDISKFPEDATKLTPAQNAMWTTQKMMVANNPNGRINAFVRGLYEDSNHEVLVLINQNGGPGLTPQGSGEIWQMVPATTPGLVNTSANVISGPTATATQPTVISAITTPPTGVKTVPITLTAKNMAFDTNRITVPSGSTVTMTFVNNDKSVPHNFALYTDTSATSKIFAGDLTTGVNTVTYTFTVPSKPGNYFFRCDVHPEMMVGTFVVT